jgi:hypothetical protein
MRVHDSVAEDGPVPAEPLPLFADTPLYPLPAGGSAQCIRDTPQLDSGRVAGGPIRLPISFLQQVGSATKGGVAPGGPAWSVEPVAGHPSVSLAWFAGGRAGWQPSKCWFTSSQVRWLSDGTEAVPVDHV